MAMKAIPVEVRARILKLYDQGKGTSEIAASFGYCVAAVRRVRQHFKVCGTLEPPPARRDWSICRRIRRTSIRWSRCEARLSKN
jgi:transposase-like protein